MSILQILAICGLGIYLGSERIKRNRLEDKLRKYEIYNAQLFGKVSSSLMVLDDDLTALESDIESIQKALEVKGVEVIPSSKIEHYS